MLPQWPVPLPRRLSVPAWNATIPSSSTAPFSYPVSPAKPPPPLGDNDPHSGVPPAYQLRPMSPLLSADEFRRRKAVIIQAAIPAGTLSNELSSWRRWVEHCALWGTDPWRSYLPAYSTSPDCAGAREDLLTLAASFIESCYLTMRPRSRGTFPKPSSAYKKWGDIARIHQREGLPRLDPTHLAQFVKGLTADYKARHGFDALLVRRKEPIRDAEHAHLL